MGKKKARGSKKLQMGRLFITFLMIVVGLALTPSISESVTGVTGANTTHYPNVSGSARAMALLIPLFWVIIVLAIGVVAVWLQFKGM